MRPTSVPWTTADDAKTKPRKRVTKVQLDGHHQPPTAEPEAFARATRPLFSGQDTVGGPSLKARPLYSGQEADGRPSLKAKPSLSVQEAVGGPSLKARPLHSVGKEAVWETGGADVESRLYRRHNRQDTCVPSGEIHLYLFYAWG